MISSSYHPPGGSQNSTPQPQRSTRSNEGSPSGSSLSNFNPSGSSLSNFNNMPTNEILSSATTRSAFLQSLQRSREREERRELERSSRNLDSELFERNKEGHRGFSDSSNSHPVNSSTDNYNNYSPIMSRRRLSSISTAGSPSSPKPASNSTPIKPISSSTPVSQSKLASHAYTMSRSSTDDEFKEREQSFDDSGIRSSKLYSFDDYNKSERKSEGAYNLSKFDEPRESVGSLAAAASTLSSDEFKRQYENNYSSFKTGTDPVANVHASTNALSNDLKGLIDSVVESHVNGLKNDLQSLHVEMIKQSLVQQNAFRSLLETYLPLTGKLMEALGETREENERLKMRIEELSRRRL